MSKLDQWCFTWPEEDPNAGPGQDRAALLRGAKWMRGATIAVSFLDGDSAVQEKVKQAAEIWTGPFMANLTFRFMDKPDEGDIRISFRYEGSWSVLGTTCRYITDPKRPTMNYGWLDQDSTDDEIEQVVLHEFGHALGLIHEHQSPGGKIQWDRDQVIADLSGPPNNWSLETIEHNLFEPYDAEETNFTALDPASIMMYPIPERWTLDDFSVGLNADLSKLDRWFIRQVY